MEGAIGASGDSYMTYETADIVNKHRLMDQYDSYVHHSHDALQSQSYHPLLHSEDSLHSEGAAGMNFGGLDPGDMKLSPPPEIYGLNKVLRSRSMDQNPEEDGEPTRPPLMPRCRGGWSPTEPYIPPLPAQHTAGHMSTFKGSQSSDGPASPTHSLNSPVKSPSIKERIMEAFSPKARRKKMRAPSPPKSPQPQDVEAAKPMSPDDSSSPSWPTPPQLSPLKSPMSMLPPMTDFGSSTAIMNRHFLDKEHSPGLQDEDLPQSNSTTITESSRDSSSREISPSSYTVTDSTTSLESSSSTASSFTGHHQSAARYVSNVLSPIGELSPLSDSSSPKTKRKMNRLDFQLTLSSVFELSFLRTNELLHKST